MKSTTNPVQSIFPVGIDILGKESSLLALKFGIVSRLLAQVHSGTKLGIFPLGVVCRQLNNSP